MDGTRWTPTPQEAVATVAKYGSIAETARALGIARATVQARLRHLGVDASTVWVEAAREQWRARDARIIDLRREGWSVTRIGVAVGLTPMRVWQVLKRDLPAGDPACGPLRKGVVSGAGARSGAS